MPLYNLTPSIIGEILDYLDDGINIGSFLIAIKDDHRYSHLFNTLLWREFRVSIGLGVASVDGLILKENLTILLREKDNTRSFKTTLIITGVWTLVNVATVLFLISFLLKLSATLSWAFSFTVWMVVNHPIAVSLMAVVQSLLWLATERGIFRYTR
ncbi:hypothetical protein DICA3_F14642 [Diutina catenulata]